MTRESTHAKSEQSGKTLACGWRIFLFLLGSVLLGLAVWGAFHGKLDAATAAIAAIGALMLLGAIVGRVTSVKVGGVEAVFANAAQGDDEAAETLALAVLRETDPDAAAYRDRVTTLVLNAARHMNLPHKAIDSIVGLNVVVGDDSAGSRRVIGVDIRTGTGFDAKRVAGTYKSLLDPDIPVVDAMLAIIRCAPSSDAIRRLDEELFSVGLDESRFVAIGWLRVHGSEPIRMALDRLRTTAR